MKRDYIYKRLADRLVSTELPCLYHASNCQISIYQHVKTLSSQIAESLDVFENALIRLLVDAGKAFNYLKTYRW